MAVTAKLSDRRIKTLKPQEKDYVLTDGNGLQLRVRANGSKAWNFNYIHPSTKKRVNMGLGIYPTVTLTEARTKTLEARELVQKGIDPKLEREKEDLMVKVAGDQTLLVVAEMWLDVKRTQVLEDTAHDILRALELHIFPDLKDVPITEITAPMVIATLKPLEAKGSLESVKRVSQRMNEIMTYAVNFGIIQSNPLSGIKETFKKPKKEHLPSLPPERLPELLKSVMSASVTLTTQVLILWQLHTMTRPSEAAKASWDEIDLKNKVWNIPAERMKKKRPHNIPLSEPAIALLEIMRPYSGKRPFIFPSSKDLSSHINPQTANMALKRMGFGGQLVSHGLRSMASTTLNEQGDWDSELIEVALAHIDKNEVRSAYNRSDYLERRRPMMDWWSDHIVQATVKGLTEL